MVTLIEVASCAYLLLPGTQGSRCLPALLVLRLHVLSSCLVPQIVTPVQQARLDVLAHPGHFDIIALLHELSTRSKRHHGSIPLRF